jgi:hypothetical protein
VAQEGEPEEFEDQHVIIEGTSDEQLDDTEQRLREIFENPEVAQRLKDEQMRQLGSSTAAPSRCGGVRARVTAQRSAACCMRSSSCASLCLCLCVTLGLPLRAVRVRTLAMLVAAVVAR